ncbi:flagellar hook-associated family protein [Aquabacter sp. CN5-332]|uniref:flagellar hook-associated family protein n=1 Tax=Aquabacter sp. CN5-332 TaxID=3156608 RepID=UPI0032B50140
MRTSFLSTLTINNGPRNALPRLQAEALKANTELTTGSRADLGLDLGVRVGQSVSLRQEKASLQSLIDSNALATGQLEIAEAAVDDMTASANDMMKTLIAAPGSSSAEVIRNQARSSLNAFIATANATDGRRYVFGGTNTGEQPLNDYAGAPKAAIDAAFAAAFGGRTPDDPTISDISAADMAAFIDNQFAAEFDDASWKANWSTATDASRTAQISPTEKVAVSASANDTAIRKLAMVFTMVGELGTVNLSEAARQVVIEKARNLLGPAVTDLTTIGGKIGTSQQRIVTANEVMKRASSTLDDRMSALEAVDPAEAKSRLDMITTQIEMSYSLTQQIMKLSIINYV